MYTYACIRMYRCISMNVLNIYIKLYMCIYIKMFKILIMVILGISITECFFLIFIYINFFPKNPTSIFCEQKWNFIYWETKEHWCLIFNFVFLELWFKTQTFNEMCYLHTNTFFLVYKCKYLKLWDSNLY